MQGKNVLQILGSSFLFYQKYGQVNKATTYM